MKKLLALLCVLALLAALPCAALADGTVYTEGTLYYTVANDSITIVGCFGKKTEITVPASIAGLPVNTIASGAFADNKYLQTLYLPDTITSIQGGAIGSGVGVVYNANTDYPSLVPPGLLTGDTPLPSQLTPPPVTEETQSDPAASIPTQPETLTPAPAAPAVDYGEADISADEPAVSVGGAFASAAVSGGDVAVEDDAEILDVEVEAEDEPGPSPSAAPDETAQPDESASPEENAAGRAPGAQARIIATFVLSGIVLLGAFGVTRLTRKKKKKRKAR